MIRRVASAALTVPSSAARLAIGLAVQLSPLVPEHLVEAWVGIDDAGVGGAYQDQTLGHAVHQDRVQGQQALDALPVADVANDGLPASIGEDVGVDLDGDHGSVLSAQPPFVDVGLAGSQHALARSEQAGRVLRRNQILDGLADQLLPAITEQSTCRRVDVGVTAVEVGREHGIGSLIDGRPRVVGGSPQGSFGPPALGSVTNRGHGVQGLSDEQRTDADVHRQLACVVLTSGEGDGDLARSTGDDWLGRKTGPTGAVHLWQLHRQHCLHRLADQFLSPISEQCLALGIDEADDAAFVDHHHRIGGRFDDGQRKLLGQRRGHGWT